MADSPVQDPLGPVSVSGTQITVDQYCNNPTVITRAIAAFALQNMYAHHIFSQTGTGVTGGAILFERPNPLLTDLYAARRMQEMAPGTEFSKLAFSRGVPMVALPRKIGAEFEVFKEARKRNNVQLVLNAITQAGNTLIRDVETMALSEMAAVITSESRTTTGQSWSDAAATTFNTRTAANQPIADFIAAQTVVAQEERGIVLNGAIFNPTDWANLLTIYGNNDQGVRDALGNVGISETFVTMRQTAGKVKLYQANAVGTWENEFPLDQNTWEEPTTDRTFHYSWSISPTFAVTNQFAMLEMGGVA